MPARCVPILPLASCPADPEREARALAGLCRWAARYAPLVAVDGADGLMADVTGVAHLFGGEAELRADLHAQLEQVGLEAQSALAGTGGAAWALARHGGVGSFPRAGCQRIWDPCRSRRFASTLQPPNP